MERYYVQVVIFLAYNASGVYLQEMQKKFITWQSKTDQRLIEITSSLRGMQVYFICLMCSK